MTSKIRVTPAQVAQISTMTRELLLDTPTEELRHSLLTASGVVDRLGREMRVDGLPFETFLKYERRLTGLLREVRQLSRELRMWQKTCHTEARDFVRAAIADCKKTGDAKTTDGPSRKAPAVPVNPDGYVEAEIEDLTSRLGTMATALENGGTPEDSQVLEDVIQFAAKMNTETSQLLEQSKRPSTDVEGPVAIEIMKGIEVSEQILDSIASGRLSGAQADPSGGK